MVVGVASCSTAPTAFLVQGASQLGNDPPTLTITEPIADITRGQGDPFLIRWIDADRDSNAKIRFSLLNTVTNVLTATNALIVLVEGVNENDTTGIDTLQVPTGLIPVGTYNIQGIIADEDTTVEVFAMTTTTGTTPKRVVVTMVGAGGGPQTVPPILMVTAPAFNLSVAQDDELVVRVQPNAIAPVNTIPFDPDSDVTLYLVLDFNLDPNNDDPVNYDPSAIIDLANPDPSAIIVLETRTVAAGAFGEEVFTKRIDLAKVPARPDGKPYYIRVTADDGTNPRVHQYAVGTINVVQLAAGTVDLADIGKKLSGARLYGFNPGANLGSSVAYVQDFDADGIDDFVVVARFGNPQSVGPVGEAYLLYGRDKLRFGGTISVNSISQTVSGVVFQAPPVRTRSIPDFFARTEGITDVSFIRDMSGDGRPELLFALPHVHGAYDSTDYDPGDENPTDINPFGCYPDPYVNNFTDSARDWGFFAGGMAVLVNSQNRDNDPTITPRPLRLDTTAIALEYSGQWAGIVLDGEGDSASGFIYPRADNANVDPLGSDPSEQFRIAGARFIAGGFDYIFQYERAREDLFGQNVNSLGDLTGDGLDEIIISSPRNERYLHDLVPVPELGYSPLSESTMFVGSITVLPGRNYNLESQRDLDDGTGTSTTPFLDHHNHGSGGSCTSTPPSGRHYDIPVQMFEIFSEDIDDMLGGGRSAGDFNQDGLDDILCGASLNDRRTTLLDTGATYIIYGRTTFGEIQLIRADDSQLRPPMLRIRGLSTGDQIGWRQTAGLDVNGDRIDDVFIGSPRVDFGDVTGSKCDTVDPNDLREVSFHDCQVAFGDEVFFGDYCKVFDYDNDGDIDDDDRCVFCCLSDDCEPDSTCVHGRNPLTCCEHLVDNGFVGIVFGGQTTDGDRDITQVGTTDLAGVVFYGGKAGDRAGMDVSSAGDFNHDGFGDILIAAPGERRLDNAGRERVGVVYLVFGGTHLQNPSAKCNDNQFCWNLSDPERGVGSPELPGIIFLSPYVAGRPNEAAPTTVGFIGDINHDGYGDILIGNPKADFMDQSFPQEGPNEPGSDPSSGRRSDAGDAYIVYGSNFGSNRSTP
jgi:hypothetical protein